MNTQESAFFALNDAAFLGLTVREVRVAITLVLMLHRTPTPADILAFASGGLVSDSDILTGEDRLTFLEWADCLEARGE